jgi:hypothetical protein
MRKVLAGYEELHLAVVEALHTDRLHSQMQLGDNSCRSSGMSSSRGTHLPHPCPWGTLRLGNIKQSEVATVSPHTPDQFSKLLATIFHGHHPVGSIPQRGTLEHLRTAGGHPLSQAARTGRPQLWIGSSSWASVQAANFQKKLSVRPSQMIRATRSKPFALEVH